MRRWSWISLMLILLVLSACTSETNVSITDKDVDVDGDDALPSAVISDGRPANPRTTFELTCPWGEVVDPQENPYLQGNLGPDFIRSVDNPQWLALGDRDFELLNLEPIIVVEVAGKVRGIPVRILLWHEVVNMCWDTPAGQRYTYLTYCPLVNAAVHFRDDRGCGAKLKYGVSGGLFNGNLLTFDRATDKPGQRAEMFVQLYGGGMFGSCTTVEPIFQHVSWEMFQRLYPYAEVLSTNTGVAPVEGYDFLLQPYWEYWRKSDIWFPYASEGDTRLAVMQHVFGVLVPGAQKAYHMAQAEFVVNDVVGGQRIAVWYDANLDGAAGFEARLGDQELTFDYLGREAHGISLYRDDETGSVWTFDGIAVDGPLKGERLARLVGIRAFWFSWASMYPDTDLYPSQ